MPSRSGVPGVLEEHAGVLALGAVIVVANFALLLSVGGEGPDLGLGLVSIFFLFLAAGGAMTQHRFRRLPDGSSTYLEGFLRMTVYQIPSSTGEDEIRRYSERRDVLVTATVVAVTPWIFQVVDSGGAVHLRPLAIGAAMETTMMLGINAWWRAVVAARIGRA